MTIEVEHAGPAFLQDLTTDAKLSAAVMRAPLFGDAAIREVILAVGAQYASIAMTFTGSINGHDYLEYDAVLKDGPDIHGTVRTRRDETGSVVDVEIGHSPLNSALVLSSRLRNALNGEVFDEMFY